MSKKPPSTNNNSLLYQEPWNRVFAIASRVFVWGLLFFCLYLLRSFFLLIFLTFVFTYIQKRGVEKLSTVINNRTLRVILVGVSVLTIIISVAAFVFPRVADQTSLFVDKFPSYVHMMDTELLKLAKRYPMVQNLIPEIPEELPGEAQTISEQKFSPATMLFQRIVGIERDEGSSSNDFNHLLNTFRNVGARLLSTSSAFLLSLLFSFLIVLDFPNLSQKARGLANTKAGFMYNEVASSLRDFGRVLGRALEAQLFIATVNTVLTAIAVYAMGLGDKTSFLSVIVFICSFIPVAGVFISSVPICLVSLQESGFYLMMIAIALITVIHLIEAYILNPKIYGHHMRMNPVIVLIILTIGGKLFHVWGLVLGVPVCTYIFGHAIRYQEQRKVE